MNPIIKSIKKVEYCNSAELAVTDIIKGRGIAGISSVPFTELCIEPYASMQVTSEIDNNNEVYETVITARSYTRLPDRSVKLAFRVTTVMGEVLIVGGNADPFPVISQKDTFPEEISDSHLTSIEINWKGTDKPFPVLS